MDMDTGFRKGKHRFFLKAAAFIIEENCLLMTKQPQSKAYVPITGTVHLHESSKDALRRWVYEETGIHYEIKQLAVVHEHFFNETEPDGEVLECHAITFYYLLKSRGKKEWISHEYSQTQHWPLVWLKLSRIHQYAIDASFPLSWLENPSKEVVHQIVDHRAKK